jgi:hypothetical protein
MKKISHYILKYTWSIIEYSDAKGNREHKFNVWNPLAWLLLLAYAIMAGLYQFFVTVFMVMRETIKMAFGV